jgi:DNA repair exonuclease SbcCD ATPase subunit
MARYFLVTVEVEGFRGINNEGEPLKLRFSPDSVNSVFAPNAQGKSSIFEALCYAIKGKIPKLEDLPASASPSEYYANLFHSAGLATINLTFQPDDGGSDVLIRVRRDVNGTRTVDSPSRHPDPDQFLRSLETAFCLVDHRTFTRFVDDAPLRRGRSFSGLLGIGKLSEFRQALESLAYNRTINTDFEVPQLDTRIAVAQRQVREAKEKIIRAYSAITGEAPAGELDLRQLSSEVGRALAKVPLLKPHFEGRDIGEVDWRQVRDIIKEAEQSERQRELIELIQAIEILEQLSPNEGDAKDQGSLRAAAEARDAALKNTRGPLFRRLYQVVVEILDSPDWEDPKRCPACESKLPDDLACLMHERLKDYAEVVNRSQEIANSWETAPWVSRLQRLANTTSLPQGSRQPDTYRELDGQFRTGNTTEADVQSAIQLAADHESARQSVLQEKNTQLEKLRSELPPSLVTLTEQVGYGEQLASGIAEYKNSEDGLSKLRTKRSQVDQWTRFIEDAASTFADAEVRLSTQKIQALETQYRSLYQEITNNQDIVPALQKVGGSEELHLVLSRFYGLTNLSAPTLLAESYRNALAISIFLSALLTDQSSARFIVMDDVTSSFDAGHQFALMEVIRTKVSRPQNVDGPQVIMLSHDGLLEKYFDRISSESSWHHQKIQGQPPRGAVLTQTQGANRHRTTAEHFLQAGQIDQAKPYVRQYLEFKLQEIIRRVNIKVPFDFAVRDDKKQVQTCLDAITDELSIYEAAGKLILEQQQLSDIRTHHVPALIGNWLSHYATGVTASLSPHVLLSVLDTIDHFADCFMYDCICSASVQRRPYRDLSSKRCAC